MNIYEKLIEVRKSVTYLKKEKEGSQYKFVGSSQVLSSVRKALDEQGLLLVPRVTSTNLLTETVEYTEAYKGKERPKKTTTYFTELTMEFTWINAEKPEEMIVCPWYGQGVDVAGEKGVGKALTYAEKYFILKSFNIPTDKDDPDAFQDQLDGKPTEKPRGTPPQQQSPAPATETTKQREEIRALILEMAGGDVEHAKAILKQITSFTGKDGKEVAGKVSVDLLTDKQVPYALKDVKRAYEAERNATEA